jgi:hypothetical protein
MDNLENFWKLLKFKHFSLKSNKNKQMPCDSLLFLATHKSSPVKAPYHCPVRFWVLHSCPSRSPTYFRSGNGGHWLSLVAAQWSCLSGRQASNFFSSSIHLYEVSVAAEDTKGQKGRCQQSRTPWTWGRVFSYEILLPHCNSGSALSWVCDLPNLGPEHTPRIAQLCSLH